MPKDPWRNYAASKRLERKGYFKKYIYRGEGPQTTEASCGDCIEQSEVQEEIEQNIFITGNVAYALNLNKKEDKMKNGEKKKVLKHLKEDKHEYKEAIKEDVKLAKDLKKAPKKK